MQRRLQIGAPASCPAGGRRTPFAVLATLAAGSGLAAAFFISDSHGLETAAGWVFLVSAWLAAHTAFAMMLEGAAGRVILPLGHLNKRSNVPIKGHEHIPLQFELGEPGVRHGQ